MKPDSLGTELPGKALGPTVAFVRDTQGRIVSMDIYADRVRKIRFARQ
jgi:hypothetical protein